MAASRDGYNPTQTVAPNGGMPGNYLTAKANPDTFGAQVGQAVQRGGQAIGAVGNELMQEAIRQQGMVNESIMTDSETLFNKELGAVKGEYQSLKGLAAVAAHDSAVQRVIQAKQKILEKLPNDAVRRGFSLLAARQEGFIIREFGEYKAGQIKAADRESAEASANVSLDNASDPTMANNDVAFNEALGNIDFQVARIVNNLGYMVGSTQDPATGKVTFSDDDVGQKAKAVYDNYRNKYIGQAWTNRLNTLAFDPQTGSVEKAVDVLTRNKDQIPSATYATMAAKFAPAYRNEQARQGSDLLIQEIDAEYEGMIGSGDEGYKTILAGLLPGITITSGTRTPEENAQVGGVENSNHLTGNAMDFVLPEGMTFKDVEARLKEGRFNVKELIDEGDHVHVAWETRSGTPVSKSAEGYTSKANYYRSNYSSIIDKARDRAEKIHPGDSTFSDNYVARVEQRISKEIREQELAIRAQQDFVLQTIQGDKSRPAIANIDQLDVNPDPRVRDAIANWRTNDPYADVKMNNLILANSRGQASSYGNQFYKLYQDVTSGKIDSPTDLLSYVGAASNSPLTNTGYEALKKIVADQGTPAGVAWSDQTNKFLSEIQKDMTIRVPGIELPALNENFQKSLMTILPRIEAGRAAGKTPAQLFDKNSPDYVGNDVKLPTTAEMTNARAQAAANKRLEAARAAGTATVNPATFKGVPDLLKAWQDKKITEEEFDKIAIERGWARAPVAAPASTTPPPVPFNSLAE